MKCNKKANLWDFAEVGSVLIVVVILGFLVYTILSNFSTAISSTNITANNQTINTTSATDFIDSSSSKTTTSLDWASLLILVGALIFTIIVSKKIPTNPMILGIIFFLFIIFVIIAAVFSNVFGGLMDNTDIATFVNLKMPITKILLIYFPYITLIYEGLAVYFLFNKNET